MCRLYGDTSPHWGNLTKQGKVRKNKKLTKVFFTTRTTLGSNWHLTLLKIKEDPMCPLCRVEYDTSLHLLGRCSALLRKQRKQFGQHLLVSSELRQEK